MASHQGSFHESLRLLTLQVSYLKPPQEISHCPQRWCIACEAFKTQQVRFSMNAVRTLPSVTSPSLSPSVRAAGHVVEFGTFCQLLYYGSIWSRWEPGSKSSRMGPLGLRLQVPIRNAHPALGNNPHCQGLLYGELHDMVSTCYCVPGYT